MSQTVFFQNIYQFELVIVVELYLRHSNRFAQNISSLLSIRKTCLNPVTHVYQFNYSNTYLDIIYTKYLVIQHILYSIPITVHTLNIQYLVIVRNQENNPATQTGIQAIFKLTLQWKIIRNFTGTTTI